MADTTIFLAGASRGVGREIARDLVGRSLKVKALLRSTAAQAELEAMGITVVFGDALNRDEVDRAMAGEPIQAVISTIGGLPQEGQRSDYLGNKHLIDAAVQAGVPRFILVSSIGSGNSAVALAPPVLQALGPVLEEKDRAEQHLIASGLNYTIIRPGGLKSEPATGTGVLTLDPTVSGWIHRADVASLVCQCLFSDTASYKVLSAIDRELAQPQAEFEPLILN